MTTKSVKKNYIYNLSYQILTLIAPLVTTPYLSRILGADGLGIVSFSESVVSYFALFAILGISTYGQREISYVQNDILKRSNVFWEMKSLEIITCGIVLFVYIVFSFIQNNSTLYLILSLNLFAVMADVTWFFQGMEEFGRIVFRNCIFKLLLIIYIFCFVRTREDLFLYVFGIAGIPFLSNLSLWSQLPKFVHKPEWRKINPFRNLKSVVELFVPTIAIQVYTVLDKTMIGLITHSSFENGYYEQAVKISKMSLTIVTALGTVMIPRIGFHYNQGNTEKVNSFMYRGYRFVWFLGIPLCFGLIGISRNFVPWFFGDGFEKVIPLLCVLSFLILAIGINSITGVQYLIPTKREKIFTITVLIGAAVNFGLNLLLIHFFQSVGAAIASVIAETTIALVQLWMVRKEYSLKEVFASSRNYLVAGVIMMAFLKLIDTMLSPSIIHTLLLIVGGACIYFSVLIILKDVFFVENIKQIVGKLINRKRL